MLPVSINPVRTVVPCRLKRNLRRCRGITMRMVPMSGSVLNVKGEAKSINPPELLAYSSFDYLKNMAVEVAIRLDGRAEWADASRSKSV